MPTETPGSAGQDRVTDSAANRAAWRSGCKADITLRDEHHNVALCNKSADHTDAHEDSIMGVTWTDEHHA